MDQKKTLEQRFMEAKIALIMNTPDDELDEVLEAGGFEPNDLEQRGKKAVNRVLASLQKDADFITSLPISKRKEIVQQLGIRHAVLDDRKREVNLRCGQIQERDIRIAELTAKLDKAREALGKILVGYADKNNVEAISTKALQELDK